MIKLITRKNRFTTHLATERLILWCKWLKVIEEDAVIKSESIKEVKEEKIIHILATIVDNQRD